MSAEYRTREVLEAVRAERRSQDAKWGRQSHDPMVWLAIAMEEVGEAAQAALQRRFADPPLSPEERGRLDDHCREELIQAAAVLVAAVECEEYGFAGPSDYEAFEAKGAT